MRTNLGLCCSLLAMASVAATSQAPNTPKQVDVHFRFQERVVTLHEPVVLLFGLPQGRSRRDFSSPFQEYGADSMCAAGLC